MNTELLTRRQAAEYLGVSSRTMDTWRADNRHISYLKFGGVVKYRRSDLDDFLAKHTRTVAA